MSIHRCIFCGAETENENGDTGHLVNGRCPKTMLNLDWLKRDKYGKKYGARYMPEQGKRVEIDGQYEVEREMRVVKANCPHCGGQVIFGLDGCAETTWLVFRRCDCAQNKVRMVIRVSNPDAVVRRSSWPTASGTVWPVQADDSFLGKFVKAVTQ